MLLNQFISDRRGNVALMFGIAIVPVMGAVGLAVDYGRATSVRTSMQSALDATALLLSKEAQTLTPEQLTKKGKDYFSTAFNYPEARNLNVTVAFATDPEGGFNVKVSASAHVDTTIGAMLGLSKMEIGSSSEVTWGMKRLELALALDNTGSMDSSNKMTELKTATRNLLDTLHKAAKKAGDVKIAIVPFATDVNVGKSNKNANWLDWSEWDVENGSCNKKSNKAKSSCEAANGKWTPASRDDWNGCVWDRDQPHDTSDTAPAGAATVFQAHQATDCPVEMLGLTDIFINNAWVSSDLTSSSPSSVLGKKVQEMNPTGNTNVTIGMAWGWHAVTKGEPLTGASEPNKDLDKVVILLTDGTNTENRWGGNTSSIDARTKLACTNAKAAGIKIYTVRVINGNADLLRDCATKPEMYFDVQNASQLSSTFSQIAKNLANLRIAK